MGTGPDASERRRDTGFRAICALLVLGILVVLLGACGQASERPAASRAGRQRTGSEPPETQSIHLPPSEAQQIVVRVGKQSFTREYVEKWTPLEVMIASKYKTGTSVPTGFVPDPPAYEKCVAYLRRVSHPPAGEARDAAELKTQCEYEHETQARSTLGHLIRDAWIYEEAAKRGISVSAAEIEREITKRGINPGILRALGVPLSYQGYVVGAELLTAKLYATLPAYVRVRKTGVETLKMGNEVDHEDLRFYSAVGRRWTPRTRCEPEFIVSGCREYSREALP